MRATLGPVSGSVREAEGAALACLALFLFVGTWWPALAGGGAALPPGPAAGQALPEAREAGGPSALLDLNAADATALERLPGLGPVLARRIVTYREIHGPFRTPEELAGISGLGENRLARLRPLVRLGEGP